RSAESYTPSLHDALPIWGMRLLERPRPRVDDAVLRELSVPGERLRRVPRLHHELVVLAVPAARLDRSDPLVDVGVVAEADGKARSEEHTSELQSPDHLVC